jgi:hypothetical protein
LLSIGTGEVLDAVRDQLGRAARTRQAFTARL